MAQIAARMQEVNAVFIVTFGILKFSIFKIVRNRYIYSSIIPLEVESMEDRMLDRHYSLNNYEFHLNALKIYEYINQQIYYNQILLKI